MRRELDSWSQRGHLRSAPGHRLTNVRTAEDGDAAILEAVFEGTHTGPLKAPSGEIPPTGKQVSIPFVVTLGIR